MSTIAFSCLLRSVARFSRYLRKLSKHKLSNGLVYPILSATAFCDDCTRQSPLFFPLSAVQYRVAANIHWNQWRVREIEHVYISFHN